MTNHPNRSWRTRMHAACAEYLARWRWRQEEFSLTSDNELRMLMTEAYVTGYEAGRASVQRKATTT